MNSHHAFFGGHFRLPVIDYLKNAAPPRWGSLGRDGSAAPPLSAGQPRDATHLPCPAVASWLLRLEEPTP
eukprot:3152479-Prymnesium_polylepis.1